MIKEPDDDALPSPCPRAAPPRQQLADTAGRCTVIRPDARSTRGSSNSSDNADDDLLALDDVLYHNRMVQAAHQQAHRDMALQTEETIVAPELVASAAEAFFDRDDGGGGSTTPASPAAVARLEKRTYDGDGAAAAARCAICIEDFEVGDVLGVMPCAHRFHEGCIAKWLGRSRVCPCCRHALPGAL